MREYKSNFFLKRDEKKSIADFKTNNVDFPGNAIVELSNACNHFCVFCNNPRMKRKINTLDKETFIRFMSEGFKLGMKEVGLYATGEPFLTKNINWYIKKSKEIGIDRIYVTSNGSLASLDKVKEACDNGLSSIKYSINAGTKENYKIIHGVDDFMKVKKNIEDVFNWKNKNNIKLQLLGSFTYTKLTKNEIPVYKKTFGKFFEDVMFFPASSQGGRINSIIEQISDHNLLKTKNEIGPCDMLWNRVHLTCEGYLTACCIDYELDLVYADFKNSNEKLNDIWNNKIIKKLRKKHIEKKLDNTVCKNCLMGTKESYEKLTNIPMKENIRLKTTDVIKRTEVVIKSI